MPLGARIVAAPIRRKGDRLSGDSSSDRLAIRRNRSTYAVGEGQQDRSADLEDLVTPFVVAGIEQFLRFRKRRRIQHIDLALPWQKCLDLQDSHAAAGQDRRLQELRLVLVGDWRPL